MREDWIECELGEVCEINMGQSPPSSTYNTAKKGLPFFQGKAEFTDLYPNVRKWCTNPTRIANEGDILLSIRAPVGSTNIANQECAIGRGLAAISYPYSNKIIWYYLKAIEQLLDKQGTGTTFRAVSGNIVRKQLFPLAPLPIQRAIVSKIEALFSDLDNGIANFKKAQEQLKIYRQAVLKKAFEGKLTKCLNCDSCDFDDEHDEKNELKQNQSNQKNHINHSSDNLPKGWKWVKISDVCDMKAGYFVKADEINSEYENGLLPCYGGNGLRGYVKSSTHEGLFPIVGRQGALCGNVHLVNGKFHATEHAVVVAAKEKIDIKCLFYKLIEMRLNQYSTGTAQPGLSVNKILPIEIIYPDSLPEQTQIVQEIESRLSVCDKVEQSITESLEKAEALRQSILKKAFEGKLLSKAEIEQCKQAADYEPASELLKKIKAEKLAKEQEKKKSTTKKKGKK